MGAFCTIPVDPLHQLSAILPMDLRLRMLSKTAALSLLSIPHSSQLIQRLGPPWCGLADLRDGPPKLPHPAPSTALTRLARLAPPESRLAHDFKHGPWVRRSIPSDRLAIDASLPHGEERKLRARAIAAEESNGSPDELRLFCHGGCPSNREGVPIATASCAASLRGKTVGILTETLGPNASSKDAAVRALSLAMSLSTTTLHEHKHIRRIKIYTSDPLLPAQCLNLRGSRQEADHPDADFAQTTMSILDAHQSLMISVGWVPPGKGLHSLRRAKAAAAEAARISTDTAFPLAPPTKDQLRTTARGEAIARWQDSWSTAARLQPAYLALTSPPDGRIPPFIQGLAKHSHLTFSTGICLLTTHAFTGEYSARFRPTSGDPHHCECGEALQTAHHVIAACPRFAAARTQHLLPLANAVSLSHIFGTKSGGEALGAFIAASQACVRPRRRDPPPEDHG
jgi:ribonuclease HI